MQDIVIASKIKNTTLRGNYMYFIGNRQTHLFVLQNDDD